MKGDSIDARAPHAAAILLPPVAFVLFAGAILLPQGIGLRLPSGLGR